MPKLVDVCKKGNSYEIYSALMVNIAEKLDNTESGRDYAAIVKSLVPVIEKVEQLNNEAKEKQKKPSPARAAQNKFRIA